MRCGKKEKEEEEKRGRGGTRKITSRNHVRPVHTSINTQDQEKHLEQD
jgi:hypothetical protein